MSKSTQRDAFWNKVYDLAKADRNIVVVSADMGAPALDRFRTDLPGQFVNVGIAEQHALLVGSGLALEGKRVFVYAIAPFITLRAVEIMRVANCMMNIPITLVGVGAGFGYEDSGPTHHLVEDIAVMRAFPNITIHSITDNAMAAAVAEISCGMKNANYVRLDRQPMDDIYKPGTDFSNGFAILKKGGDACLVGTGYMTHVAIEMAKALPSKRLGVIDVHTIPANARALAKQLQGYKKLFTLEEHFMTGGFGSYILEVLSDHEMMLPVTRIAVPMDRGYCYIYGGRQHIHDYYGISRKHILRTIKAGL